MLDVKAQGVLFIMTEYGCAVVQVTGFGPFRKKGPG
jgi:hypothetical protein